MSMLLKNLDQFSACSYNSLIMIIALSLHRQTRFFSGQCYEWFYVLRLSIRMVRKMQFSKWGTNTWLELLWKNVSFTESKVGISERLWYPRCNFIDWWGINKCTRIQKTETELGVEKSTLRGLVQLSWTPGFPFSWISFTKVNFFSSIDTIMKL